MFVGRDHELSELERLYRKGGFQMVVLYGRRRVGKTTLALEFARDKPQLVYTAKIQSDVLNLADFSREVYRFLGFPVSPGPFATWEDALVYLAQSVGNRQLVFVFDEFPYAAQKCPALVSTLQVVIDRVFSKTNIFLIVTGSNQGFMEEKVLGGSKHGQDESGLGEKNPLFGRRTSQIHLMPFGYREAALMLPGRSPVELVEFYACFGGTPYYLSAVDQDESLGENIERLYFRKEGLLFEEPLMLLRQELREPSVYSSILSSIAAGTNRSTRIADRIGIDSTAMGKYLGVLRSLGLVERVAPYGENVKTSKRAVYRISDPCFAYWYRFIEPTSDMVEQNAGKLAAAEALCDERLSTYVGHWFEAIARSWTVEAAVHRALPVAPVRFGSWWGTSNALRSQDDVDVVAGNPRTKEVLLGECKWRESVDVARMVEKQRERTALFPEYGDFALVFFTKRPVEASVRKRYEGNRMMFIDAERLYVPWE